MTTNALKGKCGCESGVRSLFSRVRKRFVESREIRLPWRNLHLSGERDCPHAFIFYAGLSANGALGQKFIARELFRRFDRRPDFWQRNLWGHTGRYGDFRESRMWNWLFDAVRAVRSLIRRPNNNEIYILGDSTGALVAILVAWLFQCAPRLFHSGADKARISGLLLKAPAFKLQSKRDTYLLCMVLALYYCISPLVMILLAFHTPRLWDPLLLTAVSLYVLLPRIRVPTGQAVIACKDETRKEVKRKCRRDQILACLLVLYFGIGPLLLLLLALVLPTFWIRAALWTFIGTIVLCIYKLPRGEVLDADWDGLVEESKCDGYYWLPVVTAATLLPLQWIARKVLSRITCPVLMVQAGCDRVVDNTASAAFFAAIPSTDKQLVVLQGIPHANLSLAQQQEVTDCLSAWLSSRMDLPESACSAGNEPMQDQAVAASQQSRGFGT